MKVLFITDLHFGIYKDIKLLDHQFETLNKLVELEKPEEIWIGGDVFHEKNPHVETIIRVKDWIEELPVSVRILLGNHDRMNKTPTSRNLLEFLTYEEPYYENPKSCVVYDQCYVLPFGTECKQWQIHGNKVNYAFIPHYYDSNTIINWWQNTGRYNQYKFIFGHWAYKGVMAHHDVEFSDTVDLNLFKDQEDCHIFLGHIHQPQDKGNVHVIGTQYSISFGESNQDKRYLVLNTYDHTFEFKPMTFGIRHIQGSFDEVVDMVKKYQKDYKLLCRVKVRELDSAYNQDIKENLLKEENVLLVDIRVIPEDVTPNKNSIKKSTEIITDDVIDEFIKNNPLDGFTYEEILNKYKEIISEAKDING
jgi:DNA repair exonuclease SbcCD nuclease subunit